MNGGTGSLVTNPEEFSVYRLADKFPKAPKTLPDNGLVNGPTVLFKDGPPHRDAHGMTLTPGSHPYLWQFDRLGNTAEVFEVRTGDRVGTVNLVGAASGDPTPDIVALSPDGTRIFAVLRGPKPQTGAHLSSGTTPGLGW